MKSFARVASSLAALTILCFAQQPAERTIPARTIPVPTTVSLELQKVIAPAWSGTKSPMALTSDEWKAVQKRQDEGAAEAVQARKQALHVAVQEEKIAGVRVYRVKPQTIAPANRNRLLVHVHGGAYVLYGGESAASEGVLMANFGKIEVVSVDYRMPPDFPFPAALDDALAVWKEIARSHDTKTMGLFGTSTGGGMTLAVVLKLKELRMPLPGAIMAGTPWSDMTKPATRSTRMNSWTTSSAATTGFWKQQPSLYAGDHDLKEPLLSPVYGDLSGFPPAILLSVRATSF